MSDLPQAIRVVPLDPSSPSWPEDVDRVRALVGAPNNPSLFPPHFLKTTFVKLGGRVLRFEDPSGPRAVAFLFPSPASAEFTMRLHQAGPAPTLAADALARLAERALGDARVVSYDPHAAHRYQPTTQTNDDVDVGSPTAADALAVRDLQREIWGSEEDFLYPTDLHSVDFRPGSSLVARVAGRPAAFLFGFYKLGGDALPTAWTRHPAALRVESQLLGVHPAFRGRRLGFLLKRLQAQRAGAEGIYVVNWTVDPLQFANAVLNFGWLQAVAFDFYPDYYPFRNDLSRVAASRLGVTWLVDSARVRHALQSGPGPTMSLVGDTRTPRIHFGDHDPDILTHAPRVAIQVPANWTTLQQHEPEAALILRRSTDALFQQWLGASPGKLILTDVAEDGPRKYLLADRATPQLLEALGA